MARFNSARQEDPSAEYWFAPKRFGYGTGLPISWQGWLSCLVYCGVVTVAALFLPQRTILGFVAVMIVATAVFLLICAKKTRGGWKWRWPGRN